MCGIIAYSGRSPAVPILLHGLKCLEYRGYDSAGVAFHSDEKIQVVKSSGKLSKLESSMDGIQNGATSGIGHTRWATHGVPNKVNAHPHCDPEKRLALVHNGIIENHHDLKKRFRSRGAVFESETDTEVLSHLIAEGCRRTGSISRAMAWALPHVQGSFAIALISREHPGRVWAARKSSPLLMGIGPEEFFLASDVPAFLSSTRTVVYLEDGDLVELSQSGYHILDIESLQEISRDPQMIEWDVQSAEKGGYPHFMLKEIVEQPAVIRDCLSGRVDQADKKVVFPELDSRPVPETLSIVACGTSYHAGLWAKYVLEMWTEMTVNIDIASEYRYRNFRFKPKELVMAITQSGETADTLAGLRIAKEHRIPVLGLCNVMGSSVAREADRVLYTQAGPEISVASTKAMCSQMTALVLLAMYWGRRQDCLPRDSERRIVEALVSIPGLLDQSLEGVRRRASELAAAYQGSRSFFYLGRGLSYPLALEGALKLKEISYVHAEGYPAGEMKHGPIALVDPDFPTFVVAPRDELTPKTVSNVQEIRAREGEVILLSTTGQDFDGVDFWELPEVAWPLSSFLALPALQLFAYEMAVALGTDVDQPRNLAKSVTVE